MPSFWECNRVRQFWEVIIPNHFDDGLWLRHSRMTKPTFEMHIFCWGKVMWVFCCALRDLFSKCVSFIVYAYVLLMDKKRSASSICRIYAHLGISTQCFLCNIPKFCIKKLVGNIANDVLISKCTQNLCRPLPSCSPLAVLSLQVYVPLSSSCTELSSSLHLFPSKCILQFNRAGWMSFPSDSQSTSVSCGPITWHSNRAVSPAFTITSLTGRMMARPGSTGQAGLKKKQKKKTRGNPEKLKVHRDFECV